MKNVMSCLGAMLAIGMGILPVYAGPYTPSSPSFPSLPSLSPSFGSTLPKIGGDSVRCVTPGTRFGQETPCGVYLGQLSANRFDPNSVSNQFGAGSRFDPKSINNPYGEYGSRYSNKSANNPYATDAPKLYDAQGNYRGKLSANKYDPDSISNPYGRYGSKYSADSINNPYGAGNRFSPDSPTNRFGNGWSIIGSK